MKLIHKYYKRKTESVSKSVADGSDSTRYKSQMALQSTLTVLPSVPYMIQIRLAIFS